MTKPRREPLVVEYAKPPAASAFTADKILQYVTRGMAARACQGPWRVQLMTSSEPMAGRTWSVDGTSGKGIKLRVQPTGECAWPLVVYPPPGMRQDLAYSLLKAQPLAPLDVPPAPAVPKVTAENRLVVGKIFQAKVLAHEPFGLRVVLVDLGVEGVVPLEDLSPTYEQAELRKYAVGRNIRVMLTDLDGGLKFSKAAADGRQGNDSARDVYTGIPDKDGTLNLRGYTVSIQRCAQLLTWVAAYAVQFPGDVAPRSGLIEHVREQFKALTGCQWIEANVLGKLLAHLVKIEWLTVTDTDGYRLTDEGWIEASGREKWPASPERLAVTDTVDAPTEPDPFEDPDAQPIPKKDLNDLPPIVLRKIDETCVAGNHRVACAKTPDWATKLQAEQNQLSELLEAWHRVHSGVEDRYLDHTLSALQLMFDRAYELAQKENA